MLTILLTTLPPNPPAEPDGSHRRFRSRLFGVIAAAFFAGVFALIPTAGASAHDYLVDSSPAANSTQSAVLKDVSLTFDDIVLDLAGNGSSSLLQVTGPDGAAGHFETGCASVSGRVVTAPVALGASGQYTVTWQIVSADGHTVSGAYAFDYQPPAGTKQAEGAPRSACGAAGSGADSGSEASSESGSSQATEAPSTATPGSAGTTNPNAPGSTSAGSASLGIVITIAAVIIGLAVIGVLIILVTSRRRPRRPDSEAEAESTPESESSDGPDHSAGGPGSSAEDD